MTSPAEALFQALTAWQDLDALVTQGECEGPYLECKAPVAPQFTADLKAKLAVSISGFANSGGGLVMWGMRTTRNGELDVLTEPTPIGNVKLFRQHVEDAMPRLSYPAPTGVELKTIHPEDGAARGALLAVIPATAGDPVQSLIDRKFWMRTGSSFSEMPYEIVKRMFLGTFGPDVVPRHRPADVTRLPDGRWRFAVSLENKSSAIAEKVVITVALRNPGDFTDVSTEGPFRDIAHLNPVRGVFQMNVPNVVHRGLPLVLGAVLMRPNAGAKAVMSIQVFANRMRARGVSFVISDGGETFVVETTNEQFLY